MIFFLKFDLTSFTIMIQIIDRRNVLAGKLKWTHCIGWTPFKLWITQQVATGSCSVKKVFWGLFLPAIWSVLDSAAFTEKKSCSVENRSTDFLLKIFVWDTEMLLFPFCLLPGKMMAFFLIFSEQTDR